MADSSAHTSKKEALPKQQAELLKLLEQEFPASLRRLPDLAWKEFGLQFATTADQALDIFRALRDDTRFSFNMLVDITAVDWLDSREERFDVVYHLLSIPHTTRLCIRIPVMEDEPSLPSVRPLWQAANWLEREIWDMFGIRFEGHGDLRRILMYEEFNGHPLRKDYPVRGKQPRIPLRVPELRNTSEDMTRGELVSLPVRQRLGGEKGS